MNATASNAGMANSLGIEGIGQISIIAHDLPRATAFYASCQHGREDRSAAAPYRAHADLRPVDGWLP